MTKKELTVIKKSLRNAKETIEELACENYPFTEFYDEELSNMFYQINLMCIKIDDKIKRLTEMGK